MRDKDIIRVLKYARSKNNELLNLMFEAKMKGNFLEDISNLVADVLSNTTKCFDYCANDIYEKYIFSKTEQNRLKKVKVYFPFYLKQLTDKKGPFNLLLKRKRVVYDFLIQLTEKSDAKELIPNTFNIKYSVAREVRDLVNADKHDKIIEVDSQGPPELVAESQAGKIVMPMDQKLPYGWRVEPFPNQTKKVKVVKSYILKENNQEVASYSSQAVGSTHQIIDIIYRKFFGTKII